MATTNDSKQSIALNVNSDTPQRPKGANNRAVYLDANSRLRALNRDGTVSYPGVSRRLESLADAATVTPNVDGYDVGIVIALSQTTTIANPFGTPIDGQKYTLRLKSASSQTINFGTQYRGSTTSALPSATSSTAKTDYLEFTYNAADTKWDLTGLNVGH